MLTSTKTFFSDKTGDKETISLQSDNAVIASGYYGVDAQQHPLKATIAADRKSLKITVLNGTNALVVTLVSQVDDEEIATLYQGDPDNNPLDYITVSGKVGAGSILIQGT
jgi:hypothetical protein